MKSAFVTLAGRPSAGKSTLINKICGHKVSIVSSSPQTTRNIIRGIYTCERGQLVFLDTPGYHISEKMINSQLRQVTESAVRSAEIILYVADCTRDIGEEERKILEYLAHSDDRTARGNDTGAALVAVINKTDIFDIPEANKEEALKSLGNFLRKSLAAPDSNKDQQNTTPKKGINKEDIPLCRVSAKSGEGVEELLDILFNLAPEGEQLYPDDIYTDQDVEFRISEIIREKAINRTKEEIPHSLYVEIADIEMRKAPNNNSIESNGETDVVLDDVEIDADASLDDIVSRKVESLWVRAFLVAESESQKGILIGKGGEKIRSIRLAAKREIKTIFPYPVTLDLQVKVNKNWRRKGMVLKRLIK